MEPMTEQFCDQIQPGKKNPREYGCIRQAGHSGRHVSGRNVSWASKLPALAGGTDKQSLTVAKIGKVGSYTGLSEDQVKQFVGCLLAVGLEIVPASQEPKAESIANLRDGSIFSQMVGGPVLNSDPTKPAEGHPSEPSEQKMLESWDDYCRLGKTFSLCPTYDAFEGGWNAAQDEMEAALERYKVENDRLQQRVKDLERRLQSIADQYAVDCL